MTHPRKIDPFIAHEMRANGAKLREIAAHFGVTTQAVTRALKRPPQTVEQVVAAHAERASERMRQLHADPDFAAARDERMRRMHADPDFAAARDERASERMRRMNADRKRRRDQAGVIFTKKILVDAERARESGVKLRDFANARGLNYGSLRVAMSKARQLPGARPGERIERERADWVERALAGATTRELAQEAGITMSSAREWLRRRGVDEETRALYRTRHSEAA